MVMHLKHFQLKLMVNLALVLEGEIPLGQVQDIMIILNQLGQILMLLFVKDLVALTVVKMLTLVKHYHSLTLKVGLEEEVEGVMVGVGEEDTLGDQSLNFMQLLLVKEVILGLILHGHR